MRNPLLFVHVVSGSIALAAMMVPLLSRKGSSLHRRAGWVFVVTMTMVSVTAFIIAWLRVGPDITPEGQEAVAVLMFAALVTAASVSAGVRVLRTRRRTGAHHHLWDIGLACVVITTSVGLLVWGLATGRPLLWAFSSVGFLTAGGQLAYWLRVPVHPKHWWFQHMAAMLGACIAAVTAFLVVNAEALGAGTFSLAIWLAPTVIGAPGTAMWVRYYRRRLSPSEAARNVTTAV